MPIIPYIGVVLPFKGSLSLDRYNFYFLMILKETLKFLLLSKPVLQYAYNNGYVFEATVDIRILTGHTYTYWTYVYLLDIRILTGHTYTYWNGLWNVTDTVVSTAQGPLEMVGV